MRASSESIWILLSEEDCEEFSPGTGLYGSAGRLEKYTSGGLVLFHVEMAVPRLHRKNLGVLKIVGTLSSHLNRVLSLSSALQPS